MILRPDEEANRSDIERDENFRSTVNKGIGTVATLGTAAGIGRIMPFLSKYIPADLAIKGLRKVSPKIADFLQRGKSMGLNVEEGIQYVKDTLNPKTSEPPAKENRNIIEQYSPELHQFIDQEIKKGRKAIEAGALAQSDKRFKQVIDKISKDHKTPWSAILQTVYGDQSIQPQQQQNQQQQPQGQGQAALMAILQKIQQSRGA